MALPKGVKSPIDYTKLYMSNELEGEVIDEGKGKILANVAKKIGRSVSKKIMKTPITKNLRGATTYSGKKISNVGKTVVQSRGSSLAPKGAHKAVTDVMKIGIGGALAAPVIQTAIDVKNLKKQQKEREIDKKLQKDYEDYIRRNELIQASHQPEGELTEKTMTSAQKRKDTMLKKKYDDSDMKKNMIAQYGKEEGEKIYFAKIRKDAMKEELNKDDKPFVKKLVGKLRKGSKTHAKQADDLEKAMKENTAIESELVIQDWKVDDIKFTEIETVDIIKAKPLKESMSNWRAELDEDWQKVNRKDKTDGLSKKAVKAYRRENPGSKLQTAVTTKPSKLKKGSKSAKRRLSFCRRMKGMKKKLTSAKTARDPDSRINKALRRWNC